MLLLLSSLAFLNSIGRLEELRKLALLALKIRVTSNMLLGDKDVGNGALVGHLLEGILNGGAIICEKEGSVSIPW